MTREEAREILTHNWTRVDNPNYSESELDEAFFMAIEALSERNIEREIATILGNERDMRVILQNAERPKGEWILVKGSNGKDYHKCSKCLHTQEITGVKNYCAVCGARMEGGDTE